MVNTSSTVSTFTFLMILPYNFLTHHEPIIGMDYTSPTTPFFLFFLPFYINFHTHKTLIQYYQQCSVIVGI